MEPGDNTGAARLQERLLGTLGQAIVNGVHPAGSILRIDDICEEFGVSRSVVREAVRVLESMLLVASRRKVGVVVLPRTEWNVYSPLIIRWRLDGPDRQNQLRSLAELRVGIEPIAAAGASLHATADAGRELMFLSEKMAEAAEESDLDALLELDIAFHACLLENSGNEMLAGLRGVVTESLRGRTVHGLMPPQPEQRGLALHAAIAAAVRAHDAEAASSAMLELTHEVRTHFGISETVPRHLT
jgi:DNA-binding FadR family transcriptional regulator